MPLENLLVSILAFFLMAAWIWVLVSVITDVFRSRDIGGVTKALWVAFIILLPWLGVLLYVLFRGRGMAERQRAAIVEAEEMHLAYIREAAGSPVSVADELEKLAALQTKGVLTEEEYASQKRRLLAQA